MKLMLAAAAALTLLPQLNASVLLDWAKAPQGPIAQEVGGPNGTYSTKADFTGVDVTVRGTDFAKSGGLSDPRIGKSPYPAPNLSTVANFRPQVNGTSATVAFTIDFFGFKQGVKDVSFDLFNVDKDFGPGRGGVPKRLDDVITFRTAGLDLTGHADNKVVGNSVIGTGDKGPASWGGPQAMVDVKSGNLPLHQIVFNWTEKILPGNQDFQEEFAIGNLIFTPVPEYGQLGIGLAAALIGGLWLARRKKAVV